jgi:hypothetical protein
MKFLLNFFLICFFWANTLLGINTLLENLNKTAVGDFVVTAQGKNYTLFHIYNKSPSTLTIEEVTVPSCYTCQGQSWKAWMAKGAPSHTSWLLYTINLSNGAIEKTFSVNRNEWVQLPANAHFLPTLLNLKLQPIPISERRKAGAPPSSGSPDFRKLWQPKMVVEGQVVKGVPFDGWYTIWPKDGSELSLKAIELYIPSENSKYPSYFPYWIQVRGAVGKATLYIIDSGSQLISPIKQQT